MARCRRVGCVSLGAEDYGFLVSRATLDRDDMGKLTFEFALDLHVLPLVGVLADKGGVQVEVLLDDIKKMVPLMIKNLLATVQRRDLALDMHPPRPVQALDVEVVEGLLLEHQR